MIGFTNEGEARVWHNENFGKNYPYHEKRTLQSTRIDESFKFDTDFVPLEEIEMVRNIINVVEDRCEEGQFPEDFRERIRQNIGFTDARRIIREELNNSERVVINRIDFMRNLVKSKITKMAGQTLGQTNYTYGSTVPVQQTFSVLQTNPNEVNRSQYQTAFVPQNKGEKSAYSFSYQKGVTA